MAQYRLSNAAKEDLIRIHHFGIEKFGITQAIDMAWQTKQKFFTTESTENTERFKQNIRYIAGKFIIESL